MFENTTSSKKQGSVGIAAAILYFIEQGYTVSVPLNDSQDYDLVVDKSGTLQRVEVKTTKCIAASRNYTVCLKSSGGTKGEIYNTVAASSANLLFVLADDGTKWLMPITPDLPKSSMTLGVKYDEFKVV